jgi:hypothetical protein
MYAYLFSLLVGDDYDPTELVASFRGYIGHFFGCHDCGQNFLRETEFYKRDVRTGSDDIKYMWIGK